MIWLAALCLDLLVSLKRDSGQNGPSWYSLAANEAVP